MDALWLAAIFFALAGVAGGILHRRALRVSPEAGSPPRHRWPGIVQVQFAGSGQNMAALLDRFEEDGRRALKQATRLDDRLVIPGYAGVLVTLSVLCALTVRHSDSAAVIAVGLAASVLAAVLAVGAAGFDYCENRALMRVLDTPWEQLAIPTVPNEAEAAARQSRRREQVAAIDTASRAVTRYAGWKLGCVVGAVGSLYVAAVIVFAM